MKHSTALLVFFIFGTCVQILAQGRMIDAATYSEMIRKAGEYRLKKNFRVKRISEYCELDNCVWKQMSVDVIEYDHPGKMRSYMVNTELGQTEPSSWFIFADGKTYAKRPKMDWQIEDNKPWTGVNPITEIVEEHYKDLGLQLVETREFKVLLKSTRSRQMANGDTIEIARDIRSWIDHTGQLAKEEYFITPSKGRKTKLTMTYEVDPTIKIEIPVK